MQLEPVHLPDRHPDTLWKLTIRDNTIHTITQVHPPKLYTNKAIAAPLLLPSLCHPHIHLDKAYLLNSRPAPPLSSSPPESDHHPSYSDLMPESNTFHEALTLTSRAKSRYTPADLRLRGSQLIVSSVQAGVTSMRAFVEIDRVTQTKCLNIAVELKRSFESACRVQICAFAQDPVFSGEGGEENRGVMEEALTRHTSATNTSTGLGNDRATIEVLGSTPYVEDGLENSRKNVDWAIMTALKHDLHLDFHLDYNLDENKEPLVWYVVDALQRSGWPTRSSTFASGMRGKGKTVVLGHCTRPALSSREEMQRLAKKIHDSHLPISFVGLPTSDIFMMGRPPPPPSQSSNSPSSSSTSWGTSLQPRGTLDVLALSRPPYNLQTCLSVNNVGNAFTPWGSVDPLSLCSLMVGLCQDGRRAACEELLGMVSTKARACIGLEDSGNRLEGDIDHELYGKGASVPADGEQKTGENEADTRKAALIKEGLRGPWLLIKNREWDELRLPKQNGRMIAEMSAPTAEGRDTDDGVGLIKVPARKWCSVTDVVWDPPDIERRKLIYD